MIDLNVLNGFLDNANKCVKDSMGTSLRCKPVCSVEFAEESGKITFSIEMRGFIRDEEAFFPRVLLVLRFSSVYFPSLCETLFWLSSSFAPR